jgi:tyrosyl-tRNA synthetase
MRMLNIEQQLAIIKRGAVEIISEEELRRKLGQSQRHKKPLVIKAGFDPTAPDIHLGHTVLLRKLKQFQDLGHKVIFLLGDFTAQIGDPSGKSEIRKQLTKGQVSCFAATYKTQVSKVLDVESLEISFNSKWFEKMSVLEMLKLTMHTTVSQMLAREDFKRRLAKSQDISLLEFMYPLLQGYDSVVLEADVELGGTDQIFNLLVGREIQKDFGKPQQVVITMPLLEGTDGTQKMSKSLGNYIGIDEPPKDIFGKLMSISDELMLKYYELLTDADLAATKKMHPREAKAKLAEELVTQYYSKEVAQRERCEFERVFAQRQAPANLTEYKIDGQKTVLNILLGSRLVKSGNEARRLIKQGAVSFNAQKIDKEGFLIQQSGTLKIGAHRFLKVICL